ncbi:response regulator [Myxococcota bacterium]|nr:response regulator [Myxococcota bacterium]
MTLAPLQPEQLVLLLTTGFVAALLLQQIFAWASRPALRLHLWGMLWASGALAWCFARSLEVASFPVDPEVAGRWTALGLASLLPQALGLVGFAGTARAQVLPRRFGPAAATFCASGTTLIVVLGAALPVPLVQREGAVVHQLPAVPLVVLLVGLAATLVAVVTTLRKQALEPVLRAVLLAAVLAWVGALANDVILGSVLLPGLASVRLPLVPHALLLTAVGVAAVAASPPPDPAQGVLRGLAPRMVAGQERLLAQALADARVAGQERQRFLARMSHELRTPLNGVIGMTDLLMDSRLDATQRRYLEQARASAEQLLALVDDLLDLSRLEAGKVRLADAPFPLRKVLEDSLRVVGVLAVRKGLELVLAAPEELPGTLVGDPLRLRQVLVNLLGNAVKFTERGEVALRVRPTSARGGRLGVRFEVADTGPGIPLEEQERILLPFEQGSRGEGRGSGLGLAISRELIRRMGGELHLQSAAGAGSVFSFELLLGLPEHQEEITIVDPVLLQGMTVLVAEDHAETAEGLLAELAGWRMQATHVADGDAALLRLGQARSEGRPFGLLLLDADMPGRDGWSVLAALQDQPGLVGATVFMLPDGAPAARFQESRARGAAATIGKPIRPAELVEAITVAVGSAHTEVGPATDPGTDPRPRVRVLVADDQAVNRELVCATLALLGVQAVAVEDGEAAVAAAAGPTPFDLVLMDLRMPRLDGEEATRRIRAFEVQSGRARVPIVALTAHAVPGDRERLLAAGLDGCLTKPLRRQALFEVMDRYRVGAMPFEIPDPPNPAPPAGASPPADASPPAGASPPADAPPAIDPDRLAQQTGGDDDLARDLLALMADELPQHRQRLAEAGRDLAALGRAAHALRGAAGNVGALPVHRAATSLEQAARDLDAERARRELPGLLAEVDRLARALALRLQA